MIPHQPVNISILVVDDAKSNRASLIAMLTGLLKSTQPHSFDVTEAVHGDDAVAKVIHKIETDGANFQLIFMDYHMPAEDELKYKDGEQATLGIRAVEKAFKLDSRHSSKIVTYTSYNRSTPFEGSELLLPKPSTFQNLEIILYKLGFFPYQINE